VTGLLAIYLIGELFFGAAPAENIPPVPSLRLTVAAPAEPLTKTVELSAKAALIMEIDSGMVLYAKSADERLPVASLTKLMTALLILEQIALEATAVVPQAAAQVEGRKAYLAGGEELTVADLLRALLIHSANDAAVTLATRMSGTEAEFVTAMNRRAHFLGLKNTRFSNPHGLDQADHYASAFDITLIAKKLLDIPFARQTVQLRERTVTDTGGRFSHRLQTTNELLYSDFPVFGLKTGTTDQAGECFVGLVRVNGRKFLVTVLGSSDRFGDTKALIWALQNQD
jgi:D-alanyl-D-alanine carboxypeptidase